MPLHRAISRRYGHAPSNRAARRLRPWIGGRCSRPDQCARVRRPAVAQGVGRIRVAGEEDRARFPCGRLRRHAGDRRPYGAGRTTDWQPVGSSAATASASALIHPVDGVPAVDDEPLAGLGCRGVQGEQRDAVHDAVDVLDVDFFRPRSCAPPGAAGSRTRRDRPDQVQHRSGGTLDGGFHGGAQARSLAELIPLYADHDHPRPARHRRPGRAAAPRRG